ncbi:hypothetical protein [Halomonas koreensis]|uniref:DUF4376 domain-containing protein n=1 Tax=Halomonas koreensis TaxID=245385 RepID=A0ABU1G4U0_9GAMM|nr:hypothetical protein [Halomonas koreensis]MDR5867973.1 hypothetical protein [Halomonas koreensis]
MRLIDQLTNHPLLEERPVKFIFEPMGFEVHVEVVEEPDPDEQPEESERYLADIEAYIDALPFVPPQGFTELGRWSNEDSEIVMLAVKPTTPLANLLMLSVDGAPTIAAIANERRRQVEAEGWSVEHDDSYRNGQLAAGAAAYAGTAAIAISERKSDSSRMRTTRWPWAEQWWKPTTPRRDLEKAGALIAAEIDRLDREDRPDESAA